ncbi:5'-methylthioadenosine nucleosidase [Marinilabiliaceae bacterium ANBcel2]|nr:5'-methylthioadenosine nucleosidase [Marinilabiliaceae bacterium ANBcel2]
MKDFELVILKNHFMRVLSAKEGYNKFNDIRMQIPVCFIIAMEAEAKPLINALSLKEDVDFAPGLPCRAFTGSFNNNPIALVLNGKDEQYNLDLIGTQAATLTTQLTIDYFHPELIISAGTAGGFQRKGAEFGDVYLSYPNVVFHDRRVDIPGWKEMGFGGYSVKDIRSIADELNLKTGVVTTGNSLDMSAQDEAIIEQLNGEVKEMEAAAIAWVATLHKTPMFCIKAVTDLVDTEHPTQEQFMTNLKLAVNNLAIKVQEVLIKLLG